MKKLVFIFMFFSVLNSFSQIKWIDFYVDLNDETDKLHAIIPVVNNETGNLAIFIKSKKEFKAILYNDNQQQLFKPVYINRLPKNSKFYVNHAFSKNKYSLIFKNNSGNKYGSIHINFETGEYRIIDKLPFSLKKETIVESFEDGNKLHLLSVKNNSSKCILYSIGLDSKVSEKEINLSLIPFENHKGSKIYLSEFLTNTYNGNKIGKINFNEPNSLEVTSSYNKLFYNDGKITYLNNFFPEHTFIIEINKDDGTYEYQKVDNITIEENPSKLGYNSFVFEAYFVSVNSTPNKLNLSIYNYKTGDVLKKYQILKNEEITFKNSPIILEGGEFNNYRELEKTSQFLRKVSNPNIGVSMYRNENNFVITLGASKEYSTGGFYPSAFGGFIGGAIGGALFSFFDSYNQSKIKSTRIECLFDENFNHIEGKVPLNGFDKINSFLDEKDLKKTPLQTVFKYQDDYIWGSYNKTAKLYSLFKFD